MRRERASSDQNSAFPGVRGKGITSRMFAMPVTNMHHPLQAQAEAGVRHGAVAAQVEVPPVGFRVRGPARSSAASSTSSRSSRWLPPMISPTPGTSTSIARTVLPSSLTRM